MTSEKVLSKIEYCLQPYIFLMTFDSQSFDLKKEAKYNIKTAFDREKTGMYDAYGYFDGSITIILNKRFTEDKEIKKNILREHSAPITDIKFIVTDRYGANLNPKFTNPSRIFLASSSFDETIIIWQLFDGNWHQVKTFNLEDCYCTTISTHQNTPLIFFGLSNGETKSFNLIEDDELIDQTTVDSESSCYAVDTSNETEFIGKSNSELEIKKGDESNVKQLSDDETNKIVFIDYNHQYVIVTCENGKLFVVDRYSYESNEVKLPSELNQFKAIMAKFEPITQAIRILSEEGKLITIMKNPDNRTYRLMKSE